MTDVVTAPEDAVIAYFSKGLNGIVLKDETVLPDIQTGPSGGLGAYVAHAGISHLLGRLELFAAQVAHLLKTDGQEHSKFGRWIFLYHVFECNEW